MKTPKTTIAHVVPSGLRQCLPSRAFGFRPWLQHAAASRLVAMLQNSSSHAIQSHRSKDFGQQTFDKHCLGALIDVIGTIGLGDAEKR